MPWVNERFIMSGLDNLKKRVTYHGGRAEDRMREDKIRGLKQALLYSYQAATAVLEDGREFRCLINPDRLNEDYDQRELSIPFKDICLNKPRQGKTSEGEEEIGIAAGDVFTWKENGSHWLVYLRYLEETAYFRATIRRCKYKIELEDGTSYWGALQGPTEKTLDWNQRSGIYWNDLNYTMALYLPRTQTLVDKIHRFTKIKINGIDWEVQAIDAISIDGIIQVYLKETFQNAIAAEAQKEEDQKQQELEAFDDAFTILEIFGPREVRPYDIVTYSVEDDYCGEWYIDSKKAKIIKSDRNSVEVEITTGKSGNFDLVYIIGGGREIVTSITILSL